MKPDLMFAGHRIKFSNEKQAYTVQATSSRYSICTKPFNPQRTVLYTIIDWKEGIRGPENTIFGLGAETQAQCYEMLIRLLEDESEVSYRRRVPLAIDWIRDRTGMDLIEGQVRIMLALKDRS